MFIVKWSVSTTGFLQLKLKGALVTLFFLSHNILVSSNRVEQWLVTEGKRIPILFLITRFHCYIYRLSIDVVLGSAGLPYTHTTHVRRVADFRGGKFLQKKK